ncbi:MAG: NAD(P)-dependent oxidoreductase [Armatimonadetes bacterium]|nr:NAD(P)-dependent oxidoreductase [Armatimonadota bacterium]
MLQLGFVGLGVMGALMAGHLLRAGHSVRVWNRTASKVKPLKKQGAQVAAGLRGLAAECDLIFICVTRAEDVEQVVEEALAAARPGTLFVDHSTIAPSAAKRLGERLNSLGHRLLDAPITGGSVGAQKGALTVFCGGGQDDFERAEPFIKAYSKVARLVGPQGSGQMMKMANQIAVCITVLSMAECLVFARKAGLDLKECIELIGGGAGGSWSLSNYGPRAAARDWSPGFSVANQQKDLVYALEAAREFGVALPGTAMVHQLLASLENEGRGGDASAALFEVIEGLSGGRP